MRFRPKTKNYWFAEIILLQNVSLARNLFVRGEKKKNRKRITRTGWLIITLANTSFPLARTKTHVLCISTYNSARIRPNCAALVHNTIYTSVSGADGTVVDLEIDGWTGAGFEELRSETGKILRVPTTRKRTNLHRLLARGLKTRKIVSREHVH